MASVGAFAWGIWSTGKDSDDIHWDDRTIGGLTEVARALLVSLVMFCDVFTVIQDWEFPCFKQPLDVKIAGTFSTELNCRCFSTLVEKLPSPPECCRGWLPDSSFFNLYIIGPWLTYGPLLVVIALDLFCMRTQLLYEPKLYGQYVDPETQRVWTIVDEDYLLQAYERGVLKKSDLITYEARRNTSTGAPLANTTAATDIELNSRYLGSALKYGAAAPGLACIALFFVIVWIGNNQRRCLDKISNLSELGNSMKEEAGNMVQAIVDTVHERMSPRRSGASAEVPAENRVFVRSARGEEDHETSEKSQSKVHPAPCEG